MNHSFTLEKYKGISSRYTCPQCGKSRKFTRYINIESGEHLNEHVGRCNREIECGYHYKPSEFFRDNPSERRTTQPSAHSPAQHLTQTQRTPSFLPAQYLEKSFELQLQSANRLIQYLKTVLGTVTDKTVKRFNVGTAKHWPGATVFWYVDYSGNIRSGKIILYNPITGKRVKEPFPHITWVHSVMGKNGLLNGFNFKMCLFGEHQLLKDPHKPVGIVESEKTAIIASAYLPTLTWMASGSLNSINSERLSPIKKNAIILYPDIRGYEAWERKAQELRTNGFNVTVSSLLEKHPAVTDEDRVAGLDLADFLPRLPLPLNNLERMEAKNPNVTDLINRFELIDIGNRNGLDNGNEPLL